MKNSRRLLSLFLALSLLPLCTPALATTGEEQNTPLEYSITVDIGNTDYKEHITNALHVSNGVTNENLIVGINSLFNTAEALGVLEPETKFEKHFDPGRDSLVFNVPKKSVMTSPDDNILLYNLMKLLSETGAAQRNSARKKREEADKAVQDSIINQASELSADKEQTDAYTDAVAVAAIIENVRQSVMRVSSANGFVPTGDELSDGDDSDTSPVVDSTPQ